MARNNVRRNERWDVEKGVSALYPKSCFLDGLETVGVTISTKLVWKGELSRCTEARKNGKKGEMSSALGIYFYLAYAQEFITSNLESRILQPKLLTIILVNDYSDPSNMLFFLLACCCHLIHGTN